MKYFLRVFLFNTFALWFVTQVLPTLTITGDWWVLFMGGLVLSLLMILVQPILSLLFLPINIITFGLLSWVVNVIVIYLLTLFVVDVAISEWRFPGFTWSGFTIPPIFFSYAPALVVSSLAITLVSNLLHGISEG